MAQEAQCTHRWEQLIQRKREEYRRAACSQTTAAHVYRNISYLNGLSDAELQLRSLKERSTYIKDPVIAMTNMIRGDIHRHGSQGYIDIGDKRLPPPVIENLLNHLTERILNRAVDETEYKLYLEAQTTDEFLRRLCHHSPKAL